MTRICEISIVENDADLLERFVASHDELAFNALVQRYGPMVLGICRRTLQSQSDADDAFQATFLLLALKARHINQPQLLGNWLFGVATRTSIGIRRSNHRRVVQEKRLMRILRPVHRDTTHDADLRMMLDEQISKLPEKLRRVIVCCHLEGLTKREAAERLNISGSAIMQRLMQAREILKRRLGAWGAGLTDASLGTILVATAVPAVLSRGTVRAATLAASGKLAATGIASGKAAGVSKGAASALMAAKIKLTVAALIGATLALGTTVAVTQLQKPSAAASAAPPTTQPALPHRSTGRDRDNRLNNLAVEIALYANKNGLPPDLKTVHASGLGVDYFGIAGVPLSKLPHREMLVIVAEHPDPTYDGPINIAFLDGGRLWAPQAVAREYIERSRAVFEAVAAGKQPSVPQMVPAHVARISTATLPPNVEEALKQNADLIGPLTIAWTNQVSTTMPAEQAMDRYYLTSRDLQPQSKRVIWQQGMLYDHGQFGSGPAHEDAFDGSVYEWSNPGHDFTKQPISELRAEGSWFLVEFLQRAGIHLPQTGAEIRTKVAVSTILKQLHNGAALVAVGSDNSSGKPLTTLTIVADNPDQVVLHSLPINRTYLYFLDPELNYAVRRVEERYDTQLLDVTENEQFEQLGSRGVWLPRKSTVRHYTARMIPGRTFSEPVTIETAMVSELGARPAPDSQFALQPAPGENIFDHVHPQPPKSSVNAAGTGVLANVPSAGGATPASPSSSVWGWVVAGATAVIAAIVILLRIKRYRPTRS